MSDHLDQEKELEYGDIYSNNYRNNNDNDNHNDKHAPIAAGNNIFADVKEKEKLIYDSVAIHFDIGIFLVQLVINSLWPFGIFLSPNIRAQLFSQTTFSAIFYNHFLTVSVYVMVISYVMMSYHADYDQFKHFQGSVWYPLLFFFLHRCSIAIKYASLSRTEYRRFMDPKNTDDVINTYTNQLQVRHFIQAIILLLYLYDS